MTTHRRNAYNRINENIGIISGINIVLSEMISKDDFSLEFINSLYSSYRSQYDASCSEWSTMYSSNECVKSRLNLESNPIVRDNMFYSYKRAAAYTRIKRLSGIMYGISIVRMILNENRSVKDVFEIKSFMIERLNNDLTEWNAYYKDNRTHNSYELKVA